LFVLLSRMAVVEQEALWRRLRAGELWAALDVFEPEPPPPDAWFRRASNVLPTPHIAGNAAYAHERCFREACADALRVLRGETPIYGASLRDRALYEGTLTPSMWGTGQFGGTRVGSRTGIARPSAPVDDVAAVDPERSSSSSAS
jgi:hypothetical protein